MVHSVLKQFLLHLIFFPFTEISSRQSHQNVVDRNSFLDGILDRDKREAAEPSSSSSNVKSSSSVNQQNSQQDVPAATAAVAAADLSKQQLLGVNGTGQRKDAMASTTEPILAATISTKALLGAEEVSAEMPPPEDFPRDVDQPDEATNETLSKHNISEMKSVSQYHCLALFCL